MPQKQKSFEERSVALHDLLENLMIPPFSDEYFKNIDDRILKILDAKSIELNAFKCGSDELIDIEHVCTRRMGYTPAELEELDKLGSKQTIKSTIEHLIEGNSKYTLINDLFDSSNADVNVELAKKLNEKRCLSYAFTIDSNLYRLVSRNPAIEYDNLFTSKNHNYHIFGYMHLTRPEGSSAFDEHDLSLVRFFCNEMSSKLMFKNLIELQHTFLKDFTTGVINSLEKKDNYTEGHSSRVAQLYIAQLQNLAVQDFKSGSEYENFINSFPLDFQIERGDIIGKLHDIGKLLVKDYILKKPSKLTSDEFSSMKKHARDGAEFIPKIKTISDAILYHHENWDGSGYPSGLKEKEIPISARMIRIGDTFDAITSTRGYRQRRSVEYAINELEKGADKEFDPYLVRLFIKIIKSEYLSKREDLYVLDGKSYKSIANFVKGTSVSDDSTEVLVFKSKTPLKITDIPNKSVFLVQYNHLFKDHLTWYYDSRIKAPVISTNDLSNDPNINNLHQELFFTNTDAIKEDETYICPVDIIKFNPVR